MGDYWKFERVGGWGGGGGVEIEGKDDAKLNRLEVCVLVGGWGEG